MPADGSSRPVVTGVRPAGPHALVIEAATHEDVAAIAAAVRARLADPDAAWSAVDVVPAARTVVIDGVVGAPIETVAREVETWAVEPLGSHAGPEVTVAVAFDGPDLADVARLWDVGLEEVVERVVGIEHRVAFCGFAPGFAYLTGLPPHWEVPRRAAPRTRVPAGAVGLAGPYAGVYPRVSPGGWQLIGRAVDAVLWDVDRDPPALLAPGTRVRFEAVEP